ncbi:3-ketoacyl-ACP reductase [Brachybacterium phenoliresistens]|uniref:3-ketoacyl-ACP reductase n=1 Tax=Brachybacterium phenoliresistens TaxID=396014 RepID=Z9JVP5_9MICO|nr:SDR family oxidoreductase [Brachybacterium phenoliresistens]EWS82038.1 3-ketoacyl-ACP reductase [Brachybacterium phenoliresistens]
MVDAYTRLVRTAPGRALAARTGLPRPSHLPRRAERPQPVLDPVVVLGSGEGAEQITGTLLGWGADVRRRFAETEHPGSVVIVLDAIERPEDIGPLVLPLAEAMRGLAAGARVVTVSRPAAGQDPSRDAARGGVEGFVRSLGHEMRRGSTANGLLVADGVALDAPSVTGALRFLLSARSAFVDGQLLRIDAAGAALPESWEAPLAGRTALVTGAARGIGAAIARTLAADGARVVLLDVTAAGTELARLANELRGVPVQLDVTAADAGDRLAAFLRERGLRLDIVVLNAGITRDRMFANMAPDRWDPVIAVNIASQISLMRDLLAADAPAAEASGSADAPAAADASAAGRSAAAPVLGDELRVVSLASTSGIAGNRGQSNYAASKAGVMAFVEALAGQLEERGGTANAVAPGFIETEMTRKIPPLQREVARRISSLQQGGLPVDVAEAVAFLASGPAGGVRGQTLRVCGQHMVGR